MSHRTGIASRWAALLLLSLCSLLLFGQDDAQHGQMNQQRTVTTPLQVNVTTPLQVNVTTPLQVNVTTPLQVNVTGCLKKSSQTGGYYVADQNGRTWELTSKKVDLAKHMNHVVSVSGHPSTGSKPQEGKSEQGPKPEGNPLRSRLPGGLPLHRDSA